VKPHRASDIHPAGLADDIDGDCEIDFEDFRLTAVHWCEERRE
jgi:hypothetical protein